MARDIRTLRRFLGGMLLVLLPWQTAMAVAEPLVFGVLAVREEARTEARYRPVLDYLEAAVPGIDFELRVFDVEGIDAALQRNEVDLLLTTPTHYEIVRSENALSSVLATQVSYHRGEAIRSLGGVILVRAGRDDIAGLADLRGKRIASPGDCCLAGYQAPLFEALNAGHDLRGSADFVFLNGHDAVIAAVREGRADAGFVRSGLVEEMVENGELRADAFKVINRQALGPYPYRVSTRLYPEWPLVVLGHVGNETERRIAAALFAMEPTNAGDGGPAGVGFGPPAEYLSVERVTRTLGLPPYEEQDRITWRQVWEQYRIESIILAASAVIILLLGIALLLRHQALRASEERFRRFFQDNDSVLLLVDFRGGVVRDANRAAARFYGWPRAELIGRPLTDIWVDDVGPENTSGIEARDVHTARLRTGETRHVEAHATALKGEEHDEVYFVIVHDVSERIRARNALADERRRLANVIEGTHAGIWEWNIQTGEVVVNERWAEMLGYRLADLAPTTIDTWHRLVHPDDRLKAERVLDACFRGNADYYDVELRMRHHDGDWMWVVSRGRVLEWTEDGEPLRMWGTQQDVTEHKHMEQQLQLAASVFVHAREAIMITDPDARIVDVNAAFAEMTGWNREEVIGRTPAFLRSEKQDDAFYRRLRTRLEKDGYWSGELWNRRRDGTLFAERLTISRVTDADGQPTNYIALASDITAIKAYQRELEHQASHDALTGLPNRVLMADRLRRAMAETRRKGGLLAVAFLDLDGFKSVNDRFGHEMGDKLLIEVSRDFAAQLREVDTLARISGDEFVIVLGALENEAAAKPVIDRLIETAARERRIDGKPVRVSASIGYTFYPQDEPVDDEDLLRQADTAMYAAKESGRNRSCRYRSD